MALLQMLVPMANKFNTMEMSNVWKPTKMKETKIDEIMLFIIDVFALPLAIVFVLWLVWFICANLDAKRRRDE